MCVNGEGNLTVSCQLALRRTNQEGVWRRRNRGEGAARRKMVIIKWMKDFRGFEGVREREKIYIKSGLFWRRHRHARRAEGAEANGVLQDRVHGGDSCTLFAPSSP